MALEAPEEMRCVLLCMVEAVEGALYLLDALEMLDVLDVMRRVLLCMPEAAGLPLFSGGAGFLVLFAIPFVRGVGGVGVDGKRAILFAGGIGGAGGDAMRATLYGEGYGGWALLPEA